MAGEVNHVLYRNLQKDPRPLMLRLCFTRGICCLCYLDQSFFAHPVFDICIYLLQSNVVSVCLHAYAFTSAHVNIFPIYL